MSTNGWLDACSDMSRKWEREKRGGERERETEKREGERGREGEGEREKEASGTEEGDRC